MEVFLLLVLATASATACNVSPVVDGHTTAVRNAMDASLEPSLGWILSPDCCSTYQTSFRVALFDSAGENQLYTSQKIKSNLSDAVPFSTWAQQRAGPQRGAVQLEPGVSYSIQVAVTCGAEDELPWSIPTAFHTQFTPALYATHATPMWTANKSALFTMFRYTFSASTTVRNKNKNKNDSHLFLAISAKPSRDHLTHGRNTSHLLSAYKLWVNGIPLGTGPGRTVGQGIAIDTYV